MASLTSKLQGSAALVSSRRVCSALPVQLAVPVPTRSIAPVTSFAAAAATSVQARKPLAVR
jgi:hypothetical protein